LTGFWEARLRELFCLKLPHARQVINALGITDIKPPTPPRKGSRRSCSDQSVNRPLCHMELDDATPNMGWEEGGTPRSFKH
jgi:hypothetical protein